MLVKFSVAVWIQVDASLVSLVKVAGQDKVEILGGDEKATELIRQALKQDPPMEIFDQELEG